MCSMQFCIPTFQSFKNAFDMPQREIFQTCKNHPVWCILMWSRTWISKNIWQTFSKQGFMRYCVKTSSYMMIINLVVFERWLVVGNFSWHPTQAQEDKPSLKLNCKVAVFFILLSWSSLQFLWFYWFRILW